MVWIGGGTYSMLLAWFGSFQPAAAMQAKRATRVKRTVRYFILRVGFVEWVGFSTFVKMGLGDLDAGEFEVRARR